MTIWQTIRGLAGAEPRAYHESQYWVLRGISPTDRIFLRIDILISLMIGLASIDYWPVVLVRIARIILAGGLLQLLLRQTRMTPGAHHLYFLIAMMASIETAIAGYLGLQADNTNYFFELQAIVVFNIGTMIILHPQSWQSRVTLWLVSGAIMLSFAIASQAYYDLAAIATGATTIACLAIVSTLFERRHRYSIFRIHQLSQSIRRKNQELARSYASLQAHSLQLQAAQNWQQDALLSNLAKGVVHEIAQPISAASNYLHQLKLDAPDNEWLNKASENLTETRLRLNEFRQLFTGARTETADDSLSSHELIETAIASLERTQPGTFVVTPWRQQPAPILRQSRAVMTQVLLNVMSNAINSTRRLNRPVNLSIQIEQANGRVTLTIANDGPDIVTELLPNLFEVSRPNHPEGFGLGLALSKKILNSTGGDIYLVSGKTPVAFAIEVEQA